MSGKISYRCTQCEKIHEGLPAIAFDAPAYYYGIPEAERAAGAILTDDLCAVDDEHYFVRAVLEIPVIGHEERLEWGVWGSLSGANFERYQATFYDHDQSKLGPMFSWFASQLPGYPETLGLRCNVIPCDHRRRPHVDLDPAQDHALVLDKTNGISLERAIAFVMPALHKH